MMPTLTARDHESALLARCVDIVRQQAAPMAKDQREANVFRLAAMVVRPQFPRESQRLMQASELYFSAHPEDRMPADAVVRHGWVFSLPRLRDTLSRQLLAQARQAQSQTHRPG